MNSACFSVHRKNQCYYLPFYSRGYWVTEAKVHKIAYQHKASSSWSSSISPLIKQRRKRGLLVFQNGVSHIPSIPFTIFANQRNIWIFKNQANASVYLSSSIYKLCSNELSGRRSSPVATTMCTWLKKAEKSKRRGFFPSKIQSYTWVNTDLQTPFDIHCF